MAKSRLVYEVNHELEKWKALSAQIQGDDIDPQTILDTLEGETDLYEALLVIADQALEYEYAAKAVAERISDLQARQSRLKQSGETLRAMILQAMDTANIPTIPGTDCTLSKGKVAGKTVINDEAAIPSKYWKPQPPALDKKALKDALKEGVEIPGATLSNGGISLTIRKK